MFSDSIEEHETRLLHVLSRLKEYGLKLSLEKCKFFQVSVRYLGHIVSRNGVETDPQKIEALKAWPSLRNLKELRSFLGFAGYYRRFIQDFSKIVKPLNDLTVGYPPLRKGSRIKENHNQYFQPSEPFGGRWTDSCQEAFKTIIDKLTTARVRLCQPETAVCVAYERKYSWARSSTLSRARRDDACHCICKPWIVSKRISVSSP